MWCAGFRGPTYADTGLWGDESRHTVRFAAVVRDNNFNFLRMLAAFAVLFSHSFALASGSDGAQPLKGLLGIGLGAIAVDVFFVTSGYLVTASVMRRSLVEFFVARLLRIYPALIVCITLTVLVLGPAMTSSSHYFDASTWSYFWHNVLLAPGSPNQLPGVFEGNPHGDAVNGSLWTLPYEIRLYAVVFVAWICTAFKPRLFLAVTVAAALVALAWLLYQDISLPHLAWMFFAGSVLYGLKLRFDGRIAAGVAIALVASAVDHRVFVLVYPLAVPYLVLFAALELRGPWLAYNRLGDYSYGVYIYAFPVQQTVIALRPGAGAAFVFVVSAAITVALAVLSWHLIEKRALALKMKNARPLAPGVPLQARDLSA